MPCGILKALTGFKIGINYVFMDFMSEDLIVQRELDIDRKWYEDNGWQERSPLSTDLRGINEKSMAIV